jgi:hypothetical protein
MHEEEIILLMKDGREDKALEKYITLEKFDEAEFFCEKNNSAENGLLTALLRMYFEKYNSLESISNHAMAANFRSKAINLIQKHSSDEELDPIEVLDMIPEDWDLETEDYDLSSFLKSVFDFKMTQEENQKILEKLAHVERVNTFKERNTLQSAYLVINEEMMCKVCKLKLGHKKIRIFPHG